MEAENSMFSVAQLNSIQYLLNPSWEKDLREITDRNSPQSILELVNIEKLCMTDTRNVKVSMENGKFNKRCIVEIQNLKTDLSNKQSRKKYRVSLQQLKRKRNDFMREKQELEKEIAFYTRQLRI